MIAALTAAWSWFVGTKVGRWLIDLAAIVAAAGAALGWVYFKGKHAQAAQDAAQRAKETAESAQVAQDVYRGASDAAAKVQADAAKQAPPDPIKRDDFDGTF